MEQVRSGGPLLVSSPHLRPRPTSPSRLHPTAFDHALSYLRPSAPGRSPAHLTGSPACGKLASIVVCHVLPGGTTDRIMVLEHSHRLICRQRVVSRVGSL